MKVTLNKFIAYTIGCISMCLMYYLSISDVQAQTVGDYRSVNAGGTAYWGNASTWQYYNGSAWVAATQYPGQNSNAGTVTITPRNYCLINVSPSFKIGNIVLQSGTADNQDDATLLGFESGSSITLKVSGNVTLGTYCYMGSNIYNTGPGDVRHTFEIEGNFSGSGAHCGLVFSFYYSDAIDVKFTGSGDSRMGGFNTFRTGIPYYDPFSDQSSTLSRVIVQKNTSSAKLILEQNIYCNQSNTMTGGLYINKGTLDLEGYTASGVNTLSISSGQKLRLSDSNFPSYASYSLNTSSEVEYYGDDQNIRAASYGKLTLKGSGVKTLIGNVTVNSNMSVNSGIEVSLNGNSLTLNNTYTAGTKFRGTAASDLIFGASATLPGDLTFNSGAANLRNLTFNNNAGHHLRYSSDRQWHTYLSRYWENHHFFFQSADIC